MCLGTVYYGKKKKAELAKLPDMVKCWKVVGQEYNNRSEKYYPPIYGYMPYKIGWNEVKPISNRSGYWVAYHAFLSKKDAMIWRGGDHIVVQVKTKKTDIVAIGKQNRLLTIVTKRIWMPKPKKKPA